MISEKIKQELNNLACKKNAEIYSNFFKSRKGEYGEGDKFIGVTVPEQRKIAKKYMHAPLMDLVELVSSGIHEHRLTGFIILTYQFEKYPEQRKNIFNFYVKYHKYANNWDIIDVTAPRIIGQYLLDNNKSLLYKYAKSKNMWEKRISIVSTMAFIYNNKFDDTIKISEILLHDKHDLIHKAVGWMLRETGKRDVKVLETFLKKYSRVMPRTMLRYSIEKFSKEMRKEYLMK